jgi:hypothetical protein
MISPRSRGLGRGNALHCREADICIAEKRILINSWKRKAAAVSWRPHYFRSLIKIYMINQDR